jgi:chemotaxis protein CheZ
MAISEHDGMTASDTAPAALPHLSRGNLGKNCDDTDLDKPMFERLGGIVRLLHDSLRELGYDRSLSAVATDITDVQGRLKYVTSLTASAADKVLNTVDIAMPALDTLSAEARQMTERCEKMVTNNNDQEDYEVMTTDMLVFSESVTRAIEAEKARLLEIMMAQDFQDITGQLILKIVAITRDVEKELAQLLRDNAPAETPKSMAGTADVKTVELMNGPSHVGTAMAQDGVDDLLDSLGF